MCDKDKEELNNLGSIILNSIKEAVSNPQPLKKVDNGLLRMQAAQQGLNDYAADALREIKRREALHEECWVSIDGSKLFVNGEVVTSAYDPIMSIESFSGPATLIASELSDNEINYLLEAN